MKTPDQSGAAFQVTYLEHFALTEKPFGATPNPGFFFESRSHSEAIGRLDSFLREGKGLALIYGNVGTGKAIVCRRFLDGLDKDRYNAALIVNPLMDAAESPLRDRRSIQRCAPSLFNPRGRAPGARRLPPG